MIYILCYKKEKYDSAHIHSAYFVMSSAIKKESAIKADYFLTWIEETIII
jgi:hypothetical protein